MVMRTLATAVLAILALAGGGCGDDEAAPDPGAGPESVGEAIEFVRNFPPATSGGIREPMQVVLKDPKALADLWEKANAHLAPLPAPPKVDFAKEMVALASLGLKPTAGYAIEIVGARAVGKTTRILWSAHEPGTAASLVKLETQPWHAVILPTASTVEWVEYIPPGRRPQPK